MKPAILLEGYTSNGGSLRFDLWKHGIVDILSFRIQHSTVETMFYYLFLAPLSHPFFVDLKIVEIAD